MNPKNIKWTTLRNIAPIVVMLTGLVSSQAVRSAEEPAAEREAVVLLHGLHGQPLQLGYLHVKLLQEGYHVENIAYPSSKLSPEEIVAYLEDEFQTRNITRFAKVNFITHSLGGLVMRAYLEKHALSNLGRVVMIGPPNQGTEIVDALSEQDLFVKLVGPTGRNLGTSTDSFPKSLAPVTFELGVIAGTRAFNPFGMVFIAGEHDGTVSVDSTRVEGMRDFRTHPASHSMMLFDNEVVDDAVHFLIHGVFSE